MTRLMNVLMGLALFSGACAAPATDAKPAATNANATPATPAANTAAAARPADANPFNSLSGLDMTSGSGSGPRTPLGDPTTPTNNGNARPTAALNQADGPQVPAGANYTIFCDAFSGADHVAAAKEMKRILIANTRLRDWYIIHEDTQSALYHGYYRQMEASLTPDATPADKADAERAQRDKSMLETLPDPRNTAKKLFPRALIVPLDSPDPDAPPAWNLVNAKGVYSVQIAAYTTPDRKQAAVESVRNARAQGIEAYYYHGDGISSVCIGHWPAAAVKLPKFMADAGKASENAVPDETQTPFYDLADKPLDRNAVERLNRAGGGRVKVMEGQAQIVDPTLMETLRRYPVHAVDGVEQIATGSNEPRPSFVVQIPGQETANTATPAGGDVTTGTGNAAARARLQQRLNGIGR